MWFLVVFSFCLFAFCYLILNYKKKRIIIIVYNNIYARNIEVNKRHIIAFIKLHILGVLRSITLISLRFIDSLLLFCNLVSTFVADCRKIQKFGNQGRK